MADRYDDVPRFRLVQAPVNGRRDCCGGDGGSSAPAQDLSQNQNTDPRQQLLTGPGDPHNYVPIDGFDSWTYNSATSIAGMAAHRDGRIGARPHPAAECAAGGVLVAGIVYPTTFVVQLHRQLCVAIDGSGQQRRDSRVRQRYLEGNDS